MTCKLYRQAERLLIIALVSTLMIGPALAAGPASSVTPATDELAIRKVLMTTFDKPEARLSVEPVVSAGDHAVAGWVQGERGGRALMLRRAGQWQVQACGGEALLRVKNLQNAGVPAAEAKRIASALATAEAALSPAVRSSLNSFGATESMSANGQHPAHAAPTAQQRAPASSPNHRH